MELINKYQTSLIFTAVLLGLVLGSFSQSNAIAAKLITPFLMIMLYGLFLSLPVSELKSALKNLRFLVAGLAINFLWTPFLAYGIGAVFLKNEPALWIGFVMLMVTPCTDWYLVFTGLSKGSVSLSTSILPLNLFFQVLLLPAYLFLFFGKSGRVDLASLAEGILIMLLIPAFFSILTRMIYSEGQRKKSRFFRGVERSQILFLAFAVCAIFGTTGKSLVGNPWVLLKLLIPVLLFFVLAFLLGSILSNFLKFSYSERVSLIFTTMARNSPIALAIAVSAFPTEPLIALALVIGPLIELPVLTFTSKVLVKSADK